MTDTRRAGGLEQALRLDEHVDRVAGQQEDGVNALQRRTQRFGRVVVEPDGRRTRSRSLSAPASLRVAARTSSRRSRRLRRARAGLRRPPFRLLRSQARVSSSSSPRSRLASLDRARKSNRCSNLYRRSSRHVQRQGVRAGCRRKASPGAAEFALLATLSLAWGTSYMFTKIAVAAVSPVTLIAVRTVIASVVMLGVLAARRRWPRLTRRDIGPSRWSGYCPMPRRCASSPFRCPTCIRR